MSWEQPTLEIGSSVSGVTLMVTPDNRLHAAASMGGAGADWVVEPTEFEAWLLAVNSERGGVVPDFSRLQVGKHDVVVLRFDGPGHLDSFDALDTLRATLEKHLGFEGIIVQLVGDVDIELLPEKDARKLYGQLKQRFDTGRRQGW